MSRFLAKRLVSLEAYVPGEQPSDMSYIKLNTNESPYPPSPRTIAAITAGELEKQRLYPDPEGARLLGKLAAFYGVGRENLIIGNGSDELLAFSFLAFFDGSAGVSFPDVTYGFYPVYAELYGFPYFTIPLKEGFAIEADDYMGIGRGIVIANPNAPTGIALPLARIEDIVRSNPDHPVLIDEAYVDFGAESAVPLTKKHDNLLVIHTYSKSRSLAGARLAYAIGAAPLIDDLRKMKYSFNPYNVNRVTQLMGEAALEDDAYYEKCRREIIATREHTQAGLTELGFTVTDSAANFVFAKPPGIPGAEMHAKLKERGILVRHWDKPAISEYLRITIGTREQMDELLRNAKEILEAFGST